MSPRPRFASRLSVARSALIGAVLRPFRWFSPNTQLLFGFTALVALTTALLLRTAPTLKSIWLLALATGSYLIVWRFVTYHASKISLAISTRRAFALVGSAIFVETAVMRVGFALARAIGSESAHAPFNNAVIWNFAIPFAAASLLVTMLIDRQLGMMTGVIVAVFSGAMAPNLTQSVLFALVSCAAAAYGIRRYRERQSITLAGLVIAAVNAVTALVLFVGLQPAPTLRGGLLAAACAFGSGLLTIIFTAGGVPINESLFGILTDIKLLELSNADLPVLRELALRAPGTNQHSHAVSQLAEDACRAIGANALLARIGSLYHDIGKVAAPDHFVENQMGGNPHDHLRPVQSAKIITTHVNYGLKLAKEISLPKQIADFIPQHHGTRTLHFFLRKAQEQARTGEAVNEAEFRYPGPKPQFKEAAILMLVDSAEAAARSLAHPDPENIRAIVTRVFDAIFSDGQLEECDLTLRQLTQIREAVITSLAAIYHPRIDYPDFNVGEDDEAQHRTGGVSYQKPSDVPINPAGEVEDEAIPREPKA